MKKENDLTPGEKWEQAKEAAAEVRAENAVETARRMLDKAVALKTVAWCTGLLIAQVERLRQESSAAEA